MMFNSVDLPQPDGPTMATNSPWSTLKLTPSMTASAPLIDTKLLVTPSTTIFLSDIAPLHGLQSFEQARGAVEQQPDHADDDHAGDHEIVAIAGVARVHDQVPEAGAQRDHLGGDDDRPGDADADAHSDDNPRQFGGYHDATEQPPTRHAEIGGRAQVAPIDRVHTRRRLHDHRKHRRDEDQEDRRQVANAEP